MGASTSSVDGMTRLGKFKKAKKSRKSFDNTSNWNTRCLYMNAGKTEIHFGPKEDINKKTITSKKCQSISIIKLSDVLANGIVWDNSLTTTTWEDGFQNVGSSIMSTHASVTDIEKRLADDFEKLKTTFTGQNGKTLLVITENRTYAFRELDNNTNADEAGVESDALESLTTAFSHTLNHQNSKTMIVPDAETLNVKPEDYVLIAEVSSKMGWDIEDSQKWFQALPEDNEKFTKDELFEKIKFDPSLSEHHEAWKTSWCYKLGILGINEDTKWKFQRSAFVSKMELHVNGDGSGLVTPLFAKISTESTKERRLAALPLSCEPDPQLQALGSPTGSPMLGVTGGLLLVGTLLGCYLKRRFFSSRKPRRDSFGFLPDSRRASLNAAERMV